MDLPFTLHLAGAGSAHWYVRQQLAGSFIIINCLLSSHKERLKFRFNYVCTISDQVQGILVAQNRHGPTVCQGYSAKQQLCVLQGQRWINQPSLEGRKAH